MDSEKTFWPAALRTGAALAGATTAALLWLSARETGSPWAAVNTVAHIVDGEGREFPTGFAPRETPLGLALNASAMGFWGVVYQTLLRILKLRASPLTAAAGAAGAYLVDYHLVPDRLKPGFERRLSPAALAAVYAAFAAGLRLGGE